MKNAFVSGASTGIGLSLAQQLLEQGYTVYGVSRRTPPELVAHPHYIHCIIDFSDTDSARHTLQRFITEQKITAISRLFLNVGQFGKRIAPMSKVSVVDLEELMRVNVWSHKILLDCLLAQHVAIEHAVFPPRLPECARVLATAAMPPPRQRLTCWRKCTPWKIQQSGFRYSACATCKPF
ncbi:MAG: SDR family oxidoreductase [Limnobacter sp.]|nr:SDR family oxidoreductase [Limnobacter sp.]